MLVVQRTGWGKSAVYFIATRLLRDQGAGPTRARLAAARAHAQPDRSWPNAPASSPRPSTATTATTGTTIEADGSRPAPSTCCSISPERLNNERFRRDVLPELAQDGRAARRRRGALHQRLGPRLPARLPAHRPRAATAPARRARAVHDRDGERPGRRRHRRPARRRARGASAARSTARASPSSVVDLPRSRAAAGVARARRPARCRAPGSSTASPSPTRERVAEWLRSQRDRRGRVQRARRDPRAATRGRATACSRNEVKVVVATSALGMGFDKPDLAFVIHFQSPGSPIAYYQQVGRAGRALERRRRRPAARARGRRHPGLLHRAPRSRPASTPSAWSSCSTRARRARADRRRSRARSTSGARGSRRCSRSSRSRARSSAADGGWRRTRRSRGRTTTTRVRGRHRAAAPAEQAAMGEYADDRRVPHGVPPRPARRPDGRAVRALRQLHRHRLRPVDLDPALVADRAAPTCGGDVRRSSRGKQWPPGLAGLRGRITAGSPARAGPRALRLRRRRLGPRRAARDARDRRRYPDELVDGLGRSDRSVAARSAARVGDVRAVERRRPRPRLRAPAGRRSSGWRVATSCSGLRAGAAAAGDGEQRAAAAQRRSARSPWRNRCRGGPVLLVDDIVDSRWTLTAVGIVLREAGSGPVYPFVLTRAMTD